MTHTIYNEVLSEVKVGDQLFRTVIGGMHTPYYNLTTVTKVTPNYIKCGDELFEKGTGYKRGNRYVRARKVTEGDAELITENDARIAREVDDFQRSSNIRELARLRREKRDAELARDLKRDTDRTVTSRYAYERDEFNRCVEFFIGKERVYTVAQDSHYDWSMVETTKYPNRAELNAHSLDRVLDSPDAIRDALNQALELVEKWNAESEVARAFGIAEVMRKQNERLADLESRVGNYCTQCEEVAPVTVPDTYDGDLICLNCNALNQPSEEVTG